MDMPERTYVGVIIVLLISILIMSIVPVPELTSTTAATPVKEKTVAEVRARNIKPGAVTSVTVLNSGTQVRVEVI